jgi:hypothetical protein
MTEKAKKVSNRKTNEDFHWNISGEIYELKAELNSDKRDRKKEAVKKVSSDFLIEI